MTTDTSLPATAPDNLTQVVKASILAAQARHNLNETELAEKYGIRRMTIWRLKNGQFTTIDRALIDLLVAYFDSPPQTDT